MNTEKQSQYVARDSILKLLSDSEVAIVSMAETNTKLANGDEYLDLEQLDKGVMRAPVIPVPTPMGRVLPRKAVHGETWTKILACLTPPSR